ncbi:MAG: DUF2066 domain-containing protein, partial [Magnetococcales bacterium]|nr:DUF2066 domain-containing protein [Magnetococcales bacterium]
KKEKGVEVEVALPVTGDPRQRALAMGKEEAFNRLMLRMIPTDERNKRRDALQAMRKEVGTVAERVVIRSENRRDHLLSVVVDVFFSEEGLRRLLEKQSGLAFNITSYPPVLLLLGDEKTGEVIMDRERTLFKEVIAISKVQGFSLAKPLDDMDDMVNISWTALRNKDPQLMRWLTSRYPARSIWVVAQTTGKKDKQQLLLNEILEDGTSKEYREPVTALEGEPLTVAIKTLTSRVMDSWLQSHLIHPGLRHDLILRLQHGPDLTKQNNAVNGMRKIPGVMQLSFIQMHAWESVLKVVYEGENSRLATALNALGMVVEQSDGEWVAKLP